MLRVVNTLQEQRIESVFRARLLVAPAVIVVHSITMGLSDTILKCARVFKRGSAFSAYYPYPST